MWVWSLNHSFDMCGVDMRTIPCGILQPQPLNKGFIWCQAVTQDFVWLPNSGPTSIVIPAWWRIHIHTTAYEGCQTPLTCVEWIWEPFHVSLEPQLVSKGFLWPQAVTQDLVQDSKSVPISIGITAWWRIHIHIQSIWRLSNIFDMFGVYYIVGTIPCDGFGASPLNKGFMIRCQVGTQQAFVFCMMTDPYPHPQHMKVVKHLF